VATGTAPDRAQRAAGRSRLLVISLLATLLVTALDLPWRLSGIAFGCLAIYSGSRLLADLFALRREGHRAPGRAGAIAGIGLAGLMLLVLLDELVLYPLVADQERCLARAITNQDQKQCRLDFERRQQELLRRFGATAFRA
jgi:hypothetical protein